MIPILARTKNGLAAAGATLRPPVVLVPTMGALHDGHRALLRRAHQIAGRNGSVLVSVFVNPLQFGAGEDLDRYPRSLQADVAICADEGVSVVFAPAHDQMYPAEQMITVRPGSMGDILEGAFRPGFFDGVLTVVLKLFNLVRPDVAVFGEKDAQQLALVRRMVADLNLAVQIEPVPTVREPDGLAISSRNSYLSPAERVSALALSRALRAGAGSGRRRSGRGTRGGARGTGHRGPGRAAAGDRLPGAGRPGQFRGCRRGPCRCRAVAGRGYRRQDAPDRQRAAVLRGRVVSRPAQGRRPAGGPR